MFPRKGASALPLCLLAWAGCGRLGFGLLDRIEQVPSDDAGTTVDADAGRAGLTPQPERDAALNVDAGGPDSGLPVLPIGPLACSAVSGSAFCADFDDDSQPANTGTVEVGTGSVSFENGALVVGIDDSADFASLNIALPPSQHWYLRLRMWVPSGLLIEELNFVAVGSRGVGDAADTDFNLLGTDTFQVFFDENKQRFDFDVGSIPRDQWLCFEARMSFDDQNGAVVSSFAGSSNLTVSPVDNQPVSAIDELRVGIDWAAAGQTAAQLRFDDIWISTEDYAGCP